MTFRRTSETHSNVFPSFRQYGALGGRTAARRKEWVMKTRSFGIVALTSTLSIQALAGAGPVSAAPVIVTKTIEQAEGVVADFDRIDGCIQTRVGILGNSSTTKGATASEEVGLVAISQFDNCQRKSLIDGFGETSTITQTVKSDLSGATLRMTLTFNNFATGTTLPVTVDVAFRATAKKSTTHVRDVFESEGVRFASSVATAVRTVTASGTVTLGTENVVAPGDSSVLGSIGKATSKSKTFDRTGK
jgi:hypothetical protein